MSNPYPLNNLGRQIKAHWKQYRPKMYRGLEATGELDKAVYESQERTGEAMADLVEKGMDWNQAWELIREEWAFLPAEEDEEASKRPPDPVILIERYEAERREAGAGTTRASTPTGPPLPRTHTAKENSPESDEPGSAGKAIQPPAWAGQALLWIAILGVLAFLVINVVAPKREAMVIAWVARVRDPQGRRQGGRVVVYGDRHPAHATGQVFRCPRLGRTVASASRGQAPPERRLLIYGRAVIVDLSGLDRAVKDLEDGIRALKVIVERAEKGVPVRYEEDGNEPTPVEEAGHGPA